MAVASGASAARAGAQSGVWLAIALCAGGMCSATVAQRL
jgi:hypothetical protein